MPLPILGAACGAALASTGITASQAVSGAALLAAGTASVYSAERSGSPPTAQNEPPEMMDYQQGREHHQYEPFEYQGGTAFQAAPFQHGWMPADASNPADRRAAHEAARRDYCERARNRDDLAESNRRAALNTGRHANRRDIEPGMIAVAQDAAGNAVGGYSIRGPCPQTDFNNHMGREQRAALESIRQQDRGRGHGNCAEQPITHNIEAIRRQQETDGLAPEVRWFRPDSLITITAYRRDHNDSGRYTIPTPACDTCQQTNAQYGFRDGTAPVYRPRAPVYRPRAPVYRPRANYNNN